MIMRKLTQQVICDYDDPVAETKSGKVRGQIVEGAYQFRGIKYAQAKRFHFPEEVSWEGTKEAINYGYCCPEPTTNVPPDAYLDPHFYYPQDEDCLYLNIWTPTLDPSAKKPVMVWFHGGGWFMGSGVEMYGYDGENLSAFGDVVVVTLNHRLNILGFMDLSAYGDEYKYSANCGIADLVQSLKWVRENIENFGGDPGSVTIMGQSGGGSKVLSMLQTPAADGLFHKAVMQSGGPTGSPADKETRMEFTDRVVKFLGLTKETIKEIETVDWYDLAEAYMEVTKEMGQEGKRVNWGPQYDGDYFFGHPLVYGWREESKCIPILGGSILAEFTSNALRNPYGKSKNDFTEEETRKYIGEKYGEDKVDDIIKAFEKAYPEKKLADVLFVDTSLRKGFIEFLKARASLEGAAPCYSWLMTLESPFKNGSLPWHNFDEAFMFHNAEYIETTYIPGVTERLQDQVAGAWVAFARTGNPNHELLPEWKAVTPDTVPTMLFDRECRVGVNHDKELMEILPKMGF